MAIKHAKRYITRRYHSPARGDTVIFRRGERTLGNVAGVGGVNTAGARQRSPVAGRGRETEIQTPPPRLSYFLLVPDAVPFVTAIEYDAFPGPRAPSPTPNDSIIRDTELCSDPAAPRIDGCDPPRHTLRNSLRHAWARDRGVCVEGGCDSRLKSICSNRSATYYFGASGDGT